MSIQQLLEQLQQMGFSEEALAGGLGGLSQGDIQTGAGMAAGLTPEQYGTGDDSLLTPEMFQTISPELLKGASLGAYSPMFQQKQSSMMPQLISQLGGQQAKKAFGGFAGSGGAGRQQQQAKDVYGQGMQDTLTHAMGAKTQSLGTIQGIIDNWLSTAQSFTGPEY